VIDRWAELYDALDVFLAEAVAVRKERVLAQLRPRTERALARAFREQGALFLNMLRTIRAQWPKPEISEASTDAQFPGWENLWNQAAFETMGTFESPIVDAVQASMMAGGEAIYRDFGIVAAFDVTNPQAVDYVYRHGAELVSGVNNTTKGYIRTIIGDGLDQGWSYDRLAKALTERFSEFAVGKPQQHIDSRAHGIAVTEIGNAYEQGNFITANELSSQGLTMEKSWLTVGDDNVDDECKINQAQGWIPIEDTFRSGDMQPLAHPYCRCTALYRRRRE
jgi:hypothetical protein